MARSAAPCSSAPIGPCRQLRPTASSGGSESKHTRKRTRRSTPRPPLRRAGSGREGGPTWSLRCRQVDARHHAEIPPQQALQFAETLRYIAGFPPEGGGGTTHRSAAKYPAAPLRGRYFSVRSAPAGPRLSTVCGAEYPPRTCRDMGISITTIRLQDCRSCLDE